MRHFEPKQLSVEETFGLLLGGVGPRPIALVSTVSPEGSRNLSPFSFYNAFGANPPVIAFSASRRARDNTTKHTYENLVATKECVVQAVTYDMVQQVSLASTEYPADTDEFMKSGLTPVPSDIVRPDRVAESPFQMECRLMQMIELGGQRGSGNLALCEVVKFHVTDELFVDGVIDPFRIDLVARMSADYYCRAQGDSIFVVRKPLKTIGIGYDRLPEFIKNSNIFTANNLAQLGNVERIPDESEVAEFARKIPRTEVDESAFLKYSEEGDYRAMFGSALAALGNEPQVAANRCYLAAKRALDFDNSDFAWRAALYGHGLQ